MLTPTEREVIGYSEAMWFSRNRLPTPEELLQKFNLTPKKLQAILSNEDVKKSFVERGMPVVAGRDLTPQQITAINTILNVHDRRSRAKRLQEMGINERIWNGWNKDPAFMEYYRECAERILHEGIPEAHVALVENVRRGDISSIKMLYEITGRYTGKDSNVDPRAVIIKVFEVIAKHVQDPSILKSIADDLSLMVALDQPANISPVATPKALTVVKGESTPLI